MIFVALLAAALVSPSPSPAASPTASATPSPGPPFANLSWREIGPAAAGGRVPAVAGSATDPKLYYVGAAGGGVWKSANGGQTWDPVFEKETTASIGAVTIDPTDNQTVWVGTGEANPRNDVTYGDGVYKTTDGGDHWTNAGLRGTRQISRIVVDPRNHEHVVVAALGDVFSDSSERGIYVTEDGGKTWKQTLYVGPESGASDLAMDAQNPSVLYAGIWQFQRRPWTFVSGSTEGGLYRSIDGGETWTKLSGHGLPDGPTGRIGLAVAPSDGNRVYALIESKQGILWRSDDGGANWTMVSDDSMIDARPFYFSQVAVDPKNPNRVYTLSLQFMHSSDGGKTFKPWANDVHGDFHAIWIAPNDPSRILVGEDGGYALTLDGGQNWFFSANLTIGEVYHVGLGTDNPYTVCAGLQDNLGWCGPSNSLDPSGIQNKNWFVTGGGDGVWGMPEPDDPDWIWSDTQNGSLLIYNRVTQDQWSAQPYLQTGKESWQLSSSKYRFNWESPIAFAPWRVDGKVAGWFGGNVIFQSTDRGRTWTVISPDLTRNVKAHQQPAGGPITQDVSGAEYTDTILDIEGSPRARGEIWVGTDDGLVQLTRDGGKHWANVTPPGAPQYGRFEIVAPSPLVDGTAYAVNDGHFLGDNAPYVFVTHDFGKTWSKIVAGLPPSEWARSIRPDIRNRDLVYLGTEEGIWISYDGGARWQSFKNDLPTVSVHDIRMQPQYDDLVIGTHGRDVFIIDDVRPLQELQSAVASGTRLFTPRAGTEWTQHSNDEGTYTNYAADNPPYGVTITFYQKTPQKGAPAIDILDAHGRVIRAISGTHKVHGKDVPYVSNDAGLNRYTWDFTVNGAVKWNGAGEFFNPETGPGVVPGDYSVRMTLAGKTEVRHFKVLPDPRSRFTQAEYQRVYDEAMLQMSRLSQLDAMLNNLDDLKKPLDAALADAKKANDAALVAKLQSAADARATLEDSLGIHIRGEGTQQETKLREDIFGAYQTVQQGPVTPTVEDFVARVTVEYNAGLARYNEFVGTTLASVNAALQQAGKKPIKTLPEEKPR